MGLRRIFFDGTTDTVVSETIFFTLKRVEEEMWGKTLSIM